MKRSFLAAVALTALAATAAHAQATYKKDLPDSLVKRAKITEDAAAATAQKRVPKGAITGVELEVEDGKLMYSYVLKVAGKSGVEEVNVSAMTGKIIAVEHESEATVKKEAAEDAKKEKAASKPKPKKP